jgi:hypothetical protein
MKKPALATPLAKDAVATDAKVPSPSFLAASRLAGDDEWYLIHRSQADREIRVNNVPTERSKGAQQQHPGGYATFREWLRGQKRAKYWDGVDGESSPAHAPTTNPFLRSMRREKEGQALLLSNA